MTFTRLTKDAQGVSPSKHLRRQRTLGSYHLKPKGQTRGFCMHPNNRAFWSLSSGLFLWDATTGELLNHNNLDAYAIAIQGESLLVANHAGLHQLAESQQRTLHKPQTPFSKAMFNQDGSVALLSSGASHRIWEPSHAKSHRKRWEGQEACLLPNNGGVLLFEHRPNRAAEGAPNLYCITAKTPAQQERWRLEVPVCPIGAAFLNDNAIISFADGTLSCFALQDGASLWSLKLSERSLHTPVSAQRQHLVVDDGETIFLIQRGKPQPIIEGVRIALDNQIGISPDGDWMVICEDSERLRIFGLPSGEERALGGGHTSKISGLSWINSRRLLSTSTLDTRVRVWDTDSGETSWMTELPEDHVSKLALSPDGQSFCVAYREGRVEHRDLEFGVLLGSYQVGRKAPNLLTFSLDGALLFASVGDSGHAAETVLYAWRPGPNNSEPLWSKEGGRSSVPSDLSCTRDNKHLWVFASNEASLHEIETGKLAMKVVARYGDNIKHASILADGMTAIGFITELDVYGYRMSTYFRRWNLETGKIAWSVPANIAAPLLISRDEAWAIRARFDEITLYSLASGKTIDTLELAELHDTISYIALSPDDTQVAIGTARGVILVYQIDLQGAI
jgi:WD40 repeat protein